MNYFIIKSIGKPRQTSRTGVNSGLVIVINASTADFYYPIRHTIGFNLLIFNPFEYPDNQNGVMQQLFVNPNVDAFYELQATTVESSSSVEQYSPTQRGCMFEHELPGEYAGHYSFADCLLKCKLRSIYELCGCIPFYLPNNFPDGKMPNIKCTLVHNRCLVRFQSKSKKSGTKRLRKILKSKSNFSLKFAARVDTFWPRVVEKEPEKRFTEDAIECHDCFPVCIRTSYRISSTYSTINETRLKISTWPLM